MCRFVELDRCAAAAEAGYAVGLFKVLQHHTMAKNDLLVGFPLTSAGCSNGGADDGADTGASKQRGGVGGQGSADALTPAGCMHDVRMLLRSCGDGLLDSGVLYSQGKLEVCTGGTCHPGG